MPHEDGNAYSPVVATVSLGGSVVLDVTSKPHTDEEDEGAEKKKKKAWRILQEPRSLLVTTGAAYSETLHGIAEVREDVDLRKGTVVNWELLGDPGRVGEEGGGKNVRETRISLTFREVRRVSAIGGKILGKGRGGG
ncbi:Hypothetical predicted protein [Lecanosticta acicola]|uniref:Fe2OG dioxygenase domain-containing protein n=1 Tax=Lecanosticta acicola TaxID=111012 RepID=A0AAI8YXG9_9PEZI|nr:Hypothetical predicted protein [Lecanosticta acicola]